MQKACKNSLFFPFQRFISFKSGRQNKIDKKSIKTFLKSNVKYLLNNNFIIVKNTV